MIKNYNWNKKRFLESISKKLADYDDPGINIEIIEIFFSKEDVSNIYLNADMFISAFTIFKLDEIKLDFDKDQKPIIKDRNDDNYYFDSKNCEKIYKKFGAKIRDELIRYTYYILKINYSRS